MSDPLDKGYGNRRSGRTTRIIDECVQGFFKDGFTVCIDHHYTPTMSKYVQKRVYKRLMYEHYHSNKGEVTMFVYKSYYIVAKVQFAIKAKECIDDFSNVSIHR